MKRLLLIIALMAGFVLPASAQKGMTQVGADFAMMINTGYSKAFAGVDFKIMHNLSSHYRMALAYGINGKVGPNTDWNVELDQHFIFGRVKPFRTYLTLGLGYGKYTNMQEYAVYDFNRGDVIYDEFYDLYKQRPEYMARFGLGFDIRVLPYLSMQIEATGVGSCYLHYDEDALFFCQGAQIKIGATYNF